MLFEAAGRKLKNAEEEMLLVMHAMIYVQAVTVSF
jgi:hypothetical protein